MIHLFVFLAIVYITLLDINDNKPQFTENVYKSNNIRESASNGEIVITVTATDKDINNNIRYSIHNNPKNGFKIDNITGMRITYKFVYANFVFELFVIVTKHFCWYVIFVLLVSLYCFPVISLSSTHP